MNCSRVKKLLSAFIDSELTGMEMLEIRRHTTDCPECEHELALMRFTKKSLASLRNVTPREDIVSKILMQLDTKSLSVQQRLLYFISSHWTRRYSQAAAALAACGAALIIFSINGTSYEKFVAEDNIVASSGMPVMSTRYNFPEIPKNTYTLSENKPLLLGKDNYFVNIELSKMTTR